MNVVKGTIKVHTVLKEKKTLQLASDTIISSKEQHHARDEHWETWTVYSPNDLTPSCTRIF